MLDEWLFGNNLGDRIKSAKAMKGLGEDLKQKSKLKVTHKILYFKNLSGQQKDSRSSPKQ